MIKKWLLLIWIAFTALLTANAANGDMRFRHFSTENGMPSDCIRDILQDEQGYLWFATDGGVTRYDGYNFVNYVLRCGVKDANEMNFPLSLHQNNGTIWVGTDLNLYRYNAEDDRFECFSINIDGKNKTLNINHIDSDKDGNLWLTATGIGVICLPHNGEDFETVVFPMPQVNNSLNCLLVDSRNDVWVGSNYRIGGGIFRLDKHNNAFKKVPIRVGNVNQDIRPSTIDEDENGKIWVGARHGEIFMLDPFSGEAAKYVPQTSQGQKLDRIHSIRPLENGMLMVGSDAGLGLYDVRRGLLRLYRYDDTDPNSLSGQFVYPIEIDREGGIWIGTFYGGVNYLMPDLKKFVSYQPSHFRNSIKGTVISEFLEANNGNIYIGSDDGGLNRYNTANDSFEHIPLSREGTDNVHSLALNGDDLWIGTYGDGLYRYNINTGAIKNYRSDHSGSPNSLPTNNCYDMLFDSKGFLWMGIDSHLVKYDPATDAFVNIRDLDTQIIDIDQDANGKLWIATQGNGVYYYDSEKNSWKNYRNSSGRGGLAHDHANCIEIDSKKNIWVATSGGLSKYDPDTDSFVTVAFGYDDGAVMSVVEDQGALWIATQHGLVKYQLDNSIEVFTMSDGLTSSQSMPNSILKASNGRIYVGSRRGFNAFFPYQIQSNQHKPSVVLTGIEIANQPIEVGDEHLPKEINHLDEIVLNPDDDYFSIGYASLSYVNPFKNQFSYRLEGFDKDWNNVGNLNKALYTKLPPGNYTFKVRASNSDNVWSDDYAQIRIKVLPPWYLAWYMKVLYVALIAGVISLLGYLYVRSSESKHRREIRQIKNDKEIEVYEAKLSFFTMIAHEIRTPVTLIIGPIEKMMRTASSLPSETSKQLGIINRNSQRLLYLVNQLLDFKKVEESELKVTYRPTNMAELLHNVTERFLPTFEQKDITLDVDLQTPDGFTADVDAEAITKMVSNLMNNARKFTHSKIILSMKSDAAKGTFAISVADDGVGISKENQKRIFTPFFQVADKDTPSQGGTGIGLSIVKRVIEAHGGEILIDSEVGKGTTMTAVLPIRQANVVATTETQVQHDDVAQDDKP